MKLVQTLLLGTLILCGGCGGHKEKTTSKNTCPVPSGAMAQTENLSQGVIVEMINASSYTYVRIATITDSVWAAAPQFIAKKGDTVEFSRAMPMQNYASKVLKRTFDTVYFNTAIQPKGAVACSAPMGMVGGNQKSCPAQSPQSPHADLKASSADTSFNYSGIKKPPQGKTVAELFEQKDALVGKKTLVCAVVVKVNLNIMKKNWFHLRDGTGKSGGNDLLVTSDQTLKVGDIVLVEGVVSKDKNIGFGYNFPLIIEDAKVQIQK